MERMTEIGKVVLVEEEEEEISLILEMSSSS
jgi:hypothetical protein